MEHGRAVPELAERGQGRRKVDRRHPVAQAQVVQQRYDLCRDGDIERLGNVVGDQDGGLGADRIHDHRALHHAAGEFCRVVPIALFRRWNPDLAEELHDPLATFARIPFGPDAVQLFRDLGPDRYRRIERALRLGADIGDVAADPHLARPGAENVLAGEGDPSGAIRQTLRQPVRQCAAEHGLAGAAFAIDAEDLRRVEAEGDVIEDRRGARCRRTDREVVDLQNEREIHLRDLHRSGCAPSRAPTPSG
ncbi:hypothetical protein ACVWYP_007279 [Bradyrhizobium sp. USDA 3262]